MNNITNNIDKKYKELKALLFDHESYDKMIAEKYKDSLTFLLDENEEEILSLKDLMGSKQEKLTNFFYFINRRFLYLLSNDPEIAVREKDIKFKKKLYKLIKLMGPSLLSCTQKIENREYLTEYSKYVDNLYVDPNEKDKNSLTLEEIEKLKDIPDKGINMPEESVIVLTNHGFRDDVLATVLAANRPVHIFAGCLPELYNGFNGLAMNMVGCFVTNRKNKNSRSASLLKMERGMSLGMSTQYHSEGGWNKTSNIITLPQWPAFWKFAKEHNYIVVPIIHYIEEPHILSKDNTIHTIIDDPIYLKDIPDDVDIPAYMRDIMSTWQYRMMEVYGRSKRSKEMQGFATSDELWDYRLQQRMETVDFYDKSIETKCDYRDKNIILPEDVFAPIAELNNDVCDPKVVEEAKDLVKTRKFGNFQRRY